jgi:hypothetical protein
VLSAGLINFLAGIDFNFVFTSAQAYRETSLDNMKCFLGCLHVAYSSPHSPETTRIQRLMKGSS